MFGVLLFTVPTGFPTNISATATSPTSATLAWIAPPFERQNGIIIGYDIIINDMSHGETFYISTNQTYLSIDFLQPFRMYSFSIAALTKVGIGPFSMGETVVNTPQAGRVEWLHVYAYHFIVRMVLFL